MGSDCRSCKRAGSGLRSTGAFGSSPKQSGNFRTAYLSKLSYSNVWIPRSRRPPRHQTAMFFDWDDSLLCTSFLDLGTDDRSKFVVHEQLQQAARYIKVLLTAALQIGQVFIITNAMDGWVEFTCALWMPQLLPVLRQVQIISARAMYEEDFPYEVDQWKLRTFAYLRHRFDLEILTNLFSMGDSKYEIDAVHAMSSKFLQCVVKTVKLKQMPTPAELVVQLRHVTTNFEWIMNAGCNLTVDCENIAQTPNH